MVIMVVLLDMVRVIEVMVPCPCPVLLLNDPDMTEKSRTPLMLVALLVIVTLLVR